MPANGQTFQETFGLNEEEEALPSFKTTNYEGDTVAACSLILTADLTAALRQHLPLRVRFAPVQCVFVCVFVCVRVRLASVLVCSVQETRDLIGNRSSPSLSSSLPASVCFVSLARFHSLTHTLSVTHSQ